MKLLVCDTSDKNCSAGIFEDGKEICYELSFESKTHSETFMPLVHRVMERADIRHEDLDGYAVTVGPGSFTGIRIGVTTARTMAQMLGLPCIGISSLESLAQGALETAVLSGALLVGAIRRAALSVSLDLK